MFKEALKKLWFALMTLLVSACSFQSPAYSPPAPAAAAVVDMGLISYKPRTISIRPGDTVEWRNTSILTHTVTDDPKFADHPEDYTLPSGAAPFSSGSLHPGQVFTHKFTTPGTYHYFCTRHDNYGMTGTVVVTSSPKREN
jgi:plastocyanin